MGEFELIQRFFFTRSVDAEAGVALGIGDDAALLQPTAGHHLVVTTDTLVEGVHFLADDDPVSLGHKALAVNLSDLAAMGARPRWFLLNLSLPRVDEAWLRAFAEGLQGLAQRYDLRLVGGDTVRGALSMSITALGERPHSAASSMSVSAWCHSAQDSRRASTAAYRVSVIRLPHLRQASARHL